MTKGIFNFFKIKITKALNSTSLYNNLDNRESVILITKIKNSLTTTLK